MPYSLAEQTGLTASALNAFLVPSFDVTDFRTVSLQVGGVFAGTLTFQGSNDNVTFFAVLAYSLSAAGASSTTTTTTGLFLIPIGFRFLRVQMTAFAAGSATGVVEAYLGPSLGLQSMVPVSLPATAPPIVPATTVQNSVAVAANTANTATLAGVAAKTNFLTGYSVTTQGGTGAAAGVVTITGLLNGTYTFEVGAAANNPVQVYVSLSTPLPASAVNTAIVLNVPGLGATTGAAAAGLWGFVQ